MKSVFSAARFFYTTLFFAVLSTFVCAQRGAVLYNRENGLVSNTVNDLVFDQDGFLWLATDHGLTRFDGQRFQNVPFNGEFSEFANERMTTLCYDGKDGLWVGTAGHGIVFIHTRLFAPVQQLGITQKVKDAGGAITDIAIINGNLVVAAAYRGIQVFQLNNQKVLNFKSSNNQRLLQQSTIHAVVIDEVNSEYVWGLATNQLFRLNTNSKEVLVFPFTVASDFSTPTDVSFLNAIQDSKGNFYIGTSSGSLCYFDQYQGIFKLFDPKLAIASPMSDLEWRDERFAYVGFHQQEVQLFDTRTKTFIAYKDEERTVKSPQCIAKKGTRLAIGTSGLGFYLQDEAKIYGTRMAIPTVANYYVPSNGAFTVGVHQGNVWLFQQELFELNQPKRIKKATNSIVFGNYGNDQLIALDNGRLGSISSNGYSETHHSPIKEVVSCIGASDEFLVCSDSKTLIVEANWKSDKVQVKKIPLSAFSGLVKGQLQGLYVHLNHVFLWFSEGLIIVDLTTGRCIPSQPKSFKKLMVNTCVVQQQKVYVGTANQGCFILDIQSLKNLKRYSTQTGLSSNDIREVSIDKTGDLWLRTPLSVECIQGKGGQLNTLEQLNGLESILAITHNAKGHFFWTTNACVYANRLLPIPQKEVPRPYVLKVYSINKPNPIYSQKIFSASENSVHFDFGVLDFSSGQNNVVRFRLKGLDVNWRNGIGQDGVSYFNLPGGDYVFELAIEENGRTTYTRYAISVASPFYAQWWFVVLTLLLVVGGIWLFIRVRLIRIRKTERLKAQFDAELREMEAKALRAQMNPHFLFNSLNSIRLFVMKNEIDTASNYIAKFSKLLRSILNHSRQDFISVFDEIATLKLYLEFERLRFDKGFDFDIAIDGQTVLDCQLPPMLVQPFVENAIWHGLMLRGDDQGVINLTFKREENRLEITVKDNGVGRVKSREIHAKNTLKEGSVGLQITKDRLKGLALKTGKATHLEIIDLYDDDQQALGTLVKLHIEL